MKQVPYVGHVLTGSGLQVDPSKVSAITNMAPPDCVAAVRRFIGLTNYMAKFIPDLSGIPEPLRQIEE